MYTVRCQNRLPQTFRVCKATPTAYNTTRDMALFPRLVANDFAPMFRLVDDYASHVAARSGFQSTFANSLRSFNPRFDVKETSDAYELHGELPGVDQKDINIEFTDAQTLSIKGRTETRREEGTRPGATADASAASVEAQPEPAKLPAAEETKTASETEESTPSETSSYHKPTVEDDAAEYAFVDAATETPTEPAEAEKTTVATPAPATPAPEPKQPEESSRYWVSERSVGTFHRSFAFPSRVDLEHVKASLKDGILSVVIPKAAVPASRRIQIQ